MRLTDLLALSVVPRWSIVSMLKEQNVGDHVFRTLVIAVELAFRTGTKLQGTDMMKILCHDGHESWTADLPSPIKHDIEAEGFNLTRTVPWMKSLPAWSSEDAELVFQLADRIEAYTYIKKWGHGPQSKVICAGCRDSVDRMTSDHWREAVTNVIRDIDTEVERGATYRRG